MESTSDAQGMFAKALGPLDLPLPPDSGSVPKSSVGLDVTMKQDVVSGSLLFFLVFPSVLKQSALIVASYLLSSATFSGSYGGSLPSLKFREVVRPEQFSRMQPADRIQAFQRGP